MKIYLIRHGETESNKNRRANGQRADEPLNETGRIQAGQLAEALKDEPFDIVFSSPLKRAMETAEIVFNKIADSIVIREELKERDFGDMTGKTWEEMAAEMGLEPTGAKKKDFDQEYDYKKYGGESAVEVHQRLLEFTKELKEKYSDKKVVIVTHGGILRAADFIFNKKNTGDIHNTAVMEFEI